MPRSIRDPDLEGDADDLLEDQEAPEDDADDESDDEAPDDDDDSADDEDDADDDESSDEDDESEQYEDEEPEEERRPSRGENRIARLAREAKEAREEAKRAREEIEALKRGSQTTQTAQPKRETEAERRERYLSLDPEDRMDAMMTDLRADMQGAFGAMQFQQFETADKAQFDALCAANPRIRGLAKTVETQLAQERAKGNYQLNRTTLATFLIGQRVMGQVGKAVEKQTKRAEAKKAQHKAKPTSSRSDVSANSGRRPSEAAARRKRLENLNL